MSVFRQASHKEHLGVRLQWRKRDVKRDFASAEDVPVPFHLVLEVQDVAALCEEKYYGAAQIASVTHWQVGLEGQG